MTKNKKANDLMCSFIDIIYYVDCLGIDNESESNIDLSEISNNISLRFQKSVEFSVSKGSDIRDFDEARFAVCAFIDEMLMSKKWAYQSLWKEHLLQQKYYETSNAGSEFYLRLSRLDDENCSVRAVYILCLVFGFRGCYPDTEDKQTIAKIIDNEINKLKLKDLLKTAYQTKPSTNAISKAHPGINLGGIEDLNWFGIQLPAGVYLSAASKTSIHSFIALIVLLTMYLVYSLVLDYQIQNTTVMR